MIVGEDDGPTWQIQTCCMSLLGSSGTVLLCNRRYGALLTSTHDVVNRWGEYHKVLLNSVDTPSNEEFESGHSKAGPPIHGVKVIKVVSPLMAGPHWWMRSKQDISE